MKKTKPAGQLPNLLIIGASKCGTTSLHHYLGLHPEIAMTAEKELLFFVEAFHWHRGEDWYRGHFRTAARVRGESSPIYSQAPWFPGAPARIFSLIPDARLIYLVRDPVERLISHYMETVQWEREHRPLAEILATEPDNYYRAVSSYAYQLEQFDRVFPRSQILVVQSERLDACRAETLREVFSFLGVDPGFTSPRFAARKYPSSAKRRLTAAGSRCVNARPVRWVESRLPPMPRRVFQRVLRHPLSRPFPRPRLTETERRELTDYFRADVARLRARTGQAFAGWSV